MRVSAIHPKYKLSGDEVARLDRKIARAHAMKLIYEWEMGGDGGEDTRMNLLGVTPGER